MSFYENREKFLDIFSFHLGKCAGFFADQFENPKSNPNLNSKTK